MKRMLQYAKEESPQWLYPLILTALLTGMRRGEILGLKWSRVDFAKRIITVDSQFTLDGGDAPLKTKSSYRSIYVSPKLLAVLDGMPRLSEYVFPNPRTRRVSFDAIRKIKRLFRRNGLSESFTFHDLRHYHATQLLAKGVNIKVLSRRLGHKNITTTLNVYFNYMPSLDEQSSLLLDNMIE